MIQLNLPDRVSGNAEVQVSNMIGQVIQKKLFFATEGMLQQEIELNSELPEGMYLVKVIIGDQTFIAPFNLLRQ